MKLTSPDRPDPMFDLVLERVITVPRELVWSAWTQPEHLKQWFAPEPWTTVECEMDLRPGGMFRTSMRAPEGQIVAHMGCYLEIIENERLVWTNAVAPHFRPVHRNSDAPLFTAVITLTPDPMGTLYRAVVLHGSEVDRQKHETQGFHEGWGKALDQLVASIKKRQN